MKKKSHHFGSEDGTYACGECSIRSILSMYNKQLKIRLNTENGTDEEKIKKILKEYGIATRAKYITWEKLKRRSVAYYPRLDHWVTIEKIDKKNQLILINDSDKDEAEWLDMETFCNSWLLESTVGYVIECRKQR